jgi:hypothetical protein
MIKVPARRFFSFLYFSPAAAAVDFFSHHLIRANINEEVKYCTLLHLYQPQKFTRFEKYTPLSFGGAVSERWEGAKNAKEFQCLLAISNIFQHLVALTAGISRY